MKRETKKLRGKALDWAVAVAESGPPTRNAHGYLVSKTDIDGAFLYEQIILLQGKKPQKGRPVWSPSAKWSQGGPLIEKHKVHLFFERTAKGSFGAGIPDVVRLSSDSYLVSAMRAIVTAELGDIVDVPAELMGVE